MAHYLFIESRDPFEAAAATAAYAEWACGLVANGDQVTMFLVQNGVLPARPGPRSQQLTELVNAGVVIVADEFSLRERGITAERLLPGITASPIDIVIERMADGHKVIFH